MLEQSISTADYTGPYTMADRVPPHDNEIEACVLGMIVHYPTEVVQDIERLRLSRRSFYERHHQEIFGAIQMVMREKLLPDTVTVVKRLKEEGALERVGGISYIGTLREMPTVQFEAFVKVLHDMRDRREVIKQAAAITARAHDPLEKLDSVAADLEEVVAATRKSNAGLTMRRPDEILAMSFDETDCYMGDRLIAAGQSTTILGPGGIGKSRLLLQLAAACITGRDFLGLPTHAKGKRWVILQAENSNRRLRNDLEHLRAWTGEEDWKAVCEHLFIHTLETEDDCFLSFEATTAVAGMHKAIATHAPDIIAIDALYNFASGDLNSDSEMRKTLQFLSRIAKADNPQRALVVLHHALTGKAGVGKAVGFDRASYGRNSKVLHAWTRAQINIALGSAQDSASLIVTCGKNNNGKEFEPFAARLDGERMVYDVDPQFDWDEWHNEVAETKTAEPLVPPQRVRELCVTPQSKPELIKTLMAETGCYRSSAYRYVERAERAGTIRFDDGAEVYLAC